jgi:hypothetical protein
MKENNANGVTAPLIPNLRANLRRALNFAILTIYSLKRTPERFENGVGWISDSFWNSSRNKHFFTSAGIRTPGGPALSPVSVLTTLAA